MCKIFLVAGVKPTTSKKVWEFARTIAKPMSQSNTDGLGYGAIKSNGEIFGERWLDNDTAFQSAPTEDKTNENYNGAIETKKVSFDYTGYGEVDFENTVAITMHTRWATTPKGMNNVHPFVLDGVSLIHNGVIRNHSDFKLESTCDSEAILQAYVQQKVWESPTHFQAAADMLRGYYACGVLVNTDAGPFLDIFKAHGASLYVTYVNELETWVHCTSDTDIKNVCRELGYTHGAMHSILAGKFIRVNALDGKSLSVTDFKPGYEFGTYTGHPTHSSTYNRSGTTTTQHMDTIKQLTSSVNRSNVIPYGKKRENVKVSDGMLEYFKSRPVSCEPLSEREIQEEIMNMERVNGRC